MLLIIAHHYIVHSGLFEALRDSEDAISPSMMVLLGAWGKTGINCFVLITGYFMYKSNFTIRKLLKLYLQIAFYGIVIYGIFCITGHDKFTPYRTFLSIWPIKTISTGFTSCFLIFYLFIPVLNVFVNSINRNMHKYLIALSITAFSLLPTCPIVTMTHNYVAWFVVLYFIAAYIRIYGIFPNVTHKQWGLLAIASFALGSLSVLLMKYVYTYGYIDIFDPYFFVSDCNKILSLTIAITSFMYFKDIKLRYSPSINLIGASTFGVLLIHDNNDPMRRWLWKETVDCLGHFGSSAVASLGYALLSIAIVFAVCSLIEIFRAKFIEPGLLDLVHNKSKSIASKFRPVSLNKNE